MGALAQPRGREKVIGGGAAARLQGWRVQMWLETLCGLWRLRRLLPVLGPLPLVLG